MSDKHYVITIERQYGSGGRGSSTLVRIKNRYKPQKCGFFCVKFSLFYCCMCCMFVVQ